MYKAVKRATDVRIAGGVRARGPLTPHTFESDDARTATGDRQAEVSNPQKRSASARRKRVAPRSFYRSGDQYAIYGGVDLRELGRRERTSRGRTGEGGIRAPARGSG